MNRAVILFRNVEHSRNQFRTGIDSVQFRELDRHITSDRHSTIDRVPSISGIGRNSADFRSIPEFHSEIRSCPNEITYQHNITNVGEEDGAIPVCDSAIPGIGGNR
jgi:hypothetical protein